MKRIFVIFLLVFGLPLILLAQPANDECTGAYTVIPEGPCANGNNSGATQSQTATTGTPDDDVWFSFTAVTTTQYLSVTASGTFNPVIQFFSGNCGALTSVKYYNVSNTVTESAILQGLTVGQTYYYRVYHYSATAPSVPTFTTCITNGVENDEPCSAISVNPDYSCNSVNGTIALATQTMSSTTGTASQDVWYKFIAEATTQVINVTEIGTGNFNPVIQLFSSTSCSALTSVGYKNALSAGDETYNVSGLVIGQTYYYRVYNYSSTAPTNQTFTTCVSTPPPFNECDGAQLIAVKDACEFTTYNNMNTSNTSTNTTCSTSANCYNDVWFKVVVPSSGKLSVMTDTVSFVIKGIALYTGSCGALTEKECVTTADMPSMYQDPQTSLTGLTPGDTLYVRLWASNANSYGDLKICVCSPPDCVSNPTSASDLCSSATHICNLNGYCGNTKKYNVTTAPDGYTSDKPGNLNSMLPSGVSIENNSWLKFTAGATTASFTVYVYNCAASSGIQIGVYDAGCSNFVEHTTFFNPGSSINAVLQVTGLTIGNDYLIMIDGSSGNFCYYTIATASGVSTLDAGQDTSICTGDSVVLNAISPGVGVNFNWFKRDGFGTSLIGAVNPITVSPSETTTYIVEVSGGSLCSGIKDSLVITPGICACPTANISYNGSPWCTTSLGQNVTLSGTHSYTGGKYSASPAGLTIDSISGIITPATSSAGNYTVTYTIAASAGCASTVTATTTVAITKAPTASISYSSNVFCTSLATAQPVTLTGTDAYTGGTYSVLPSGLTINASGAITPSTSTAQSYVVTYTYPALNGCPSGTDTTHVAIAAVPTANISYPASPYCSSLTASQAVTLVGTSGGSYTSTAGLTINGTSGAITPSSSTAGNYMVTYSIAASGGCPLVSDTANVTITAAPTANISYANSTFCTSLATAQPVTLTGTGAYTSGSYTASPSGLTMAASGSITPSTSTAQSYVVTYTYPASGGCPSGTDTTHVTIAALPSVVISYTASPYCSSLTLPQAVTLVGSAGGTYTTTAGLTLNATTGAITPSSSIAGTSYVVTYSVGATGGCPAVSDTANVFIAEAPSATISYASSPYCSTLTTAQAVTFAGTTGGTYSVLPLGLTMDASGGITPSTSTAGSYVVTYTTPSVAGCAAVSDTANVTITAAPTATISYAASPYCTSLNTPQAITFAGTIGGTYSSLPTGLSMNAVGAITPSTSTAGTYVVTYTIAANAGCAAVSDTANVAITAAPTAKISYTSAIFCTALATAEPVTLTGTNAYTGGSYSFLPSGLSMDGAGAITPSTSTPQLYTITYSYPASGGCAAGTADTTVTIAAIPTADIIYSGSPYCTTLTSPQAVTFTGTTGGSYTTTGGLTLNAADGSITPSTSTAGTYVVTYAILAGGGCPAVSDTANVTINAKPTVVITGVDSLCPGEFTTLKASGATSYVWDNTLTTDSITVSPIQNTTYKVTGTALGCSDTASYAVIIKPLPILSIQGGALLCIGDSIQLAATGGDSYLWSPQASLSSSSLATVKAFPQTPTTYTLVGILNGCMDSITHTISVYALPIISLSNPASGCEPLRVDFTASSTPQLQSISWNFGNGSTSTSTSPNALYLNDGVYDVSANVTDVNGCKNDTTEIGFVTVFPKPVVDFTYSPSQGMVNEPVTFTSSYTQTPAIWMWQFGDGNAQSNPFSVAIYSYVVSKTYTVTHIVQTDQGCKDTAFRQIVVLTRITIPNVLTPNNDGFNDTFIIDGLQFVEGANLKIYNRWGGKVYESDSYQNDWDGGSCSEGVYYYVLTLPDFLKLGPYSGSVTLFR